MNDFNLCRESRGASLTMEYLVVVWYGGTKARRHGAQTQILESVFPCMPLLGALQQIALAKRIQRGSDLISQRSMSITAARISTVMLRRGFPEVPVRQSGSGTGQGARSAGSDAAGVHEMSRKEKRA